MPMQPGAPGPPPYVPSPPRGKPLLLSTLTVAALVMMIVSIVWWSIGRKQQERQVTNHVMSSNNLRRIGIAIYAYADVNGEQIVPAFYGENDKAHLSWRVLLLPYLEHADLYDRFRLDEPWDSEHNRRLIAEMPAIYRSPGIDLAEGETCYLAVVEPVDKGGGTCIQDPAQLGSQRMGMPLRSRTTLGSVIDGLSNTAVVIEADPSQAVPWTKPQDVSFDRSMPNAGLFGARDNGAWVVMGDASIRYLSQQADDPALTALFLRNDNTPAEIPTASRSELDLTWRMVSLVVAAVLFVGLGIWCLIAWIQRASPPATAFLH